MAWVEEKEELAEAVAEVGGKVVVEVVGKEGAART